MPIVLKGELCSIKLNGYGNTDSEKHTNETDDAQNFPVTDVVLECPLCKITFDSLRDFETHSVSLEHVQKVLEKNSLISLSSDTYNTLKNPNTLNNQSEEKSGDEIDKQEHYDKCPTSSKTDNVLLENKTSKASFSCSHCIKEFSGPEPYKQHLESKSHKKKVALENNSFAEIKEIDGHKFCDICKKEFSGEKPFNEHLISRKHKMMEQHHLFFEQNTDEDSAPKAKKIKIESMSDIDKQYFCEICGVPSSGPIPYADHCAGKFHKRNEARFQAGVNIGAKNSSNLACSENVKESLQILKENADNDFAPKAKKVKIELASEIDKQWFCDICRKQCNGPEPYIQHCAGKGHKRNMARCQAEFKTEPSINQLDQISSNSNHINHTNIAVKIVSDLACSDNLANISSTLEKIEAEREDSRKEIDGSKPAWFCRVCKVQCSGPINFSQHLGGKGHKRLDMHQKENDCSKSKDSIGLDGTETKVNVPTEDSSFCSQKQNMCSDNINYEEELKKSAEIYSPDEEINFD